jgi:hypothetical protein
MWQLTGPESPRGSCHVGKSKLKKIKIATSFTQKKNLLKLF